MGGFPRSYDLPAYACLSGSSCANLMHLRMFDKHLEPHVSLRTLRFSFKHLYVNVQVDFALEFKINLCILWCFSLHGNIHERCESPFEMTEERFISS